MTLKKFPNCLYCLFFCAFLLQLHTAQAQNNFDTVSKWMEDHINEVGGRAVMLIYRDGKVIYSNNVNEMTRRQKFAGKMIAKKKGKDVETVLKDYTEITRIPIASCSKWLSAALVMTFIDEGKLALTDSVGKFLPVMTENGKGNITIEQCLTHLTGIKSEGLKENRKMVSEVKDMNACIAAIAKLPMAAKPGSAFNYSSTGLQIAAAVIEKISGKSFKELFNERIAKPCEMTQTDWGDKRVPLAAGGAISTATDYLHFLQMILQGGQFRGKIVLKPSSIQSMQKNYISDKQIIHTPVNAKDWGYGFGEWVMKDATDKPSEIVTSPGLFGSFPWVNNKKKYAAVFFTFNLKSKGRDELYRSIQQVVDAAIPL